MSNFLLTVSCYFANGLCSGWNQSSSDDFDWTLASGATSSSATGPSFGQGGSGKVSLLAIYIKVPLGRKFHFPSFCIFV